MFDCKLFNTDEDEVRKLLRHPHAAVALSDAGAHLSFLCDAGFGLHLFGHWVRERGDLTLPEAVRRVTSDVATAYRIADRGRIAPAPGPTCSCSIRPRWPAAPSAGSTTCRRAPAVSTPRRSGCTACG
jgi:hypothetical protein